MHGSRKQSDLNAAAIMALNERSRPAGASRTSLARTSQLTARLLARLPGELAGRDARSSSRSRPSLRTAVGEHYD